MNQQDEEIFILDYFSKHFNDFPKGKVTKSESPDFIIQQTRKRTIGIELTRLDPVASSLKEKIEYTLKNKNEKIGIYQTKKFNDIWLIIYTDFIEDSKSYNIHNKIDSWKFSSKFDKVFLFDLFEKKTFVLKK